MILRVVGASLFILAPVRVMAVVLALTALLYSCLHIVSLHRLDVGFERYPLSNHLICHLRAPYPHYQGGVLLALAIPRQPFCPFYV